MQDSDSALTKLFAAALEIEAVDQRAEFIDDAQRAIERAVAATLPGRSATAQDTFLDLAVSSRCETLPRLAAELRAVIELGVEDGDDEIFGVWGWVCAVLPR